MITRAQIGKLKSKQFFVQSSSTLTPTTFIQAQNFFKWSETMQDEINALICNGTQWPVSCNNKQNVIGCKWVYKIKQKMDGTINKYKVCLVAKEFRQCRGINFFFGHFFTGSETNYNQNDSQSYYFSWLECQKN